MKIYELIKDKLIRRAIIKVGGEVLFTKEDALRVLNEAKKQKIIVLGLDFWQKRGSDLIASNSTAWDDINQGEQASEATILQARQLISEGLPDNADYVSFVLADK